MMRRLAPLAMILAAVLLSLLGPDRVSAHGNLDQSLAGDPGCNTTNFAASVTAASGQRQTFVATGSMLSAVAICVSAAADVPVVVAIYSGAAIVGGGSSVSNPAGAEYANATVKWVHVDFPAALPVTPGATYTIENQTGAALTWHGTTAASPYTYCLGEPNTSAVVDLGFRSFLADAPGASPPCPEPTTTNTPVSPPTNTAQPPTNTPAPGETAAPANTPVPGATIAITGTDSAAAGSIPAEASVPSTAAAAPAGSTPSAAGRALPASGAGPPASAEAMPILLALLAAGALLLAAGWRCRTAR